MKISSILGCGSRVTDFQRSAENEQETKSCEEESSTSLEMRDSPRSIIDITTCERGLRRSFEEELNKRQYVAVCEKIKEIVDDFLHPYITGQIKTRNYEREATLEAILGRSLRENQIKILQSRGRNYLVIAARCFIRKGIQGFYHNFNVGTEILERTEEKPLTLVHYVLTEADTEYYDYLKTIVWNTCIQEFPSIGWTEKQMEESWKSCFKLELQQRIRDAKSTSIYPVCFKSCSGRDIKLA